MLRVRSIGERVETHQLPAAIDRASVGRHNASMNPTSNIAALENELNAALQRGEILPAYEKFYADDVVMQENADPPTKGKDANRVREKAFVDSIAEFHGMKLVGGAVGDDISFSEWMLDVTFKGGGRVVMHQAAVRRWRQGKVVSERFYYNKG
jgi:ketosteroid isomerase-like protein